MSALVNELLSFTRAEIGSDKLKPEEVLLEPMVRTIINREGAEEMQMVPRVPPDLTI